MPRIGEHRRALRQHVGVEDARRAGGVADQALDQVGLAGPLAKLPPLCEQFVRTARKHRLAVPHQPGLGKQGGVDVPQPAVRIPRQPVHPAVPRHPLPRGRSEDARRQAGRGKVGLDRFEQSLARIIGNDAAVHGDQVGRLACGHLRGQLTVAWPGDHILAHPSFGMRLAEGIDHGGDDPALALSPGDVR